MVVYYNISKKSKIESKPTCFVAGRFEASQLRTVDGLPGRAVSPGNATTFAHRLAGRFAGRLPDDVLILAAPIASPVRGRRARGGRVAPRGGGAGQVVVGCRFSGAPFPDQLQGVFHQLQAAGVVHVAQHVPRRSVTEGDALLQNNESPIISVCTEVMRATQKNSRNLGKILVFANRLCCEEWKNKQNDLRRKDKKSGAPHL
jgi:hypothetical protein